MIADKWQLSGIINEALCHHHDPNEADEEYSQMVTIVAVGNIYSNFIEIGSSGGSVPEESITNYLLEKAGISWDKLSELHETIVGEIEKARFFLEIAQKG
jgi:HD-like signal output (HDOD) protein